MDCSLVIQLRRVYGSLADLLDGCCIGRHIFYLFTVTLNLAKAPVIQDQVRSNHNDEEYVMMNDYCNKSLLYSRSSLVEEDGLSRLHRFLGSIKQGFKLIEH